MTSLLPPPKPLDLASEPWNAWKKWLIEFELFAVATHLMDQPDKVQAATLLVCIGEEGKRIYTTFTFDNEEDREKLEVLKNKFAAHMKPAINLTYHEFIFGKIDQKEGEKFDEWLTERRVLVRNCEYGDVEERMLRSRIILGTKDRQLQQKLINDNPTFDKVLEICQTRERTVEQFNEIRGKDERHEDALTVKVLTRADQATCHCCGFVHRASTCPAAGKQCLGCGKLGHFAKCCKSGTQTSDSRQRRQSKKGRKFDPKVRQVEREDTDDSDEDYLLCHLTVDKIEKEDRWSETVTIEKDSVRCKLDTRANCSVIPERLLRLLSNKKVRKCDTTQSSFFGHKRKACGRTTLTVSNGARTVQEEFFVVKEEVPVTLGGELSEQLGMIKRLASVSKEHEDTNAAGTNLCDPAGPYADVFRGLGRQLARNRVPVTLTRVSLHRDHSCEEEQEKEGHHSDTPTMLMVTLYADFSREKRCSNKREMAPPLSLGCRDEPDDGLCRECGYARTTRHLGGDCTTFGTLRAITLESLPGEDHCLPGEDFWEAGETIPAATMTPLMYPAGNHTNDTKGPACVLHNNWRDGNKL
ncbi:hypothetical protein HPB47_003059 [Ixodes persulcatus]|uniref:Uncharacterized protein n=1 Tax=Ixodes persulcatus TaxID=34615 RepID=A0AC60PKJ2_IXOPE|nr:hypothetical protein HPB47_003059 [Ixodes persulcatus]